MTYHLRNTVCGLVVGLVLAANAMTAQAQGQVAQPASCLPTSDSPPPSAYGRPIAQYGPFIVMSDTRAALVGETDERSPASFRAMLARYPRIRQLDLLDSGGTENDEANLEVGHLIRGAGLTTFVPATGSVRSGAVELFLAGVSRRISHGAEFAVHSWQDSDGYEADDFARNAPVNQLYIRYYMSLGMSQRQANAFYDMTNAAPHAEPRWLDASEMAAWSCF